MADLSIKVKDVLPRKILIRFFSITLLLVTFAYAPGSVGLCEEANKEKLEKIQKEIEKHKEKLEESRKKESNVLEDLEKADKSLEAISGEVRGERRKIKDLNARISSLRQDMATMHNNAGTIKSKLRKRLKIIQRYGYDVDKMLILLNTDDFYKLMRINRYLAKTSGKEYREMVRYEDMSVKLAGKEKELKGLLSQLVARNEILQQKEAQLAEKKKDRQTLLSSIKQEQSLYSSVLTELQTTSSRLKVLMQKQEPEMQDVGSEFRSSKGLLPWPAAGRVAIPYGSHQDPQFKTPVFRYGIYISTEDDSTIKAVYDGKVVYADWFKGLGKVVILSHGMGYHTVYANLSKMYPKVGDVVKRRSIIGDAGESAVLNGSGIYFEVRYKGKPVNPLQWLKGEGK
ncbi:MAG: peptidoglycan DD-metalloendopeptidase family protein [Nitrospirae bacterium]|nr:peptidoglycan DD-metalloendopeptidase family protein [Nitrospirota bacterium]